MTYSITRENARADLSVLRDAFYVLRKANALAPSALDTLKEIADAIEEQVTPPVEAARDAHSDQMNLELRQSIAANVLEAMDVDQYLIDAVRNATPPVEPPACLVGVPHPPHRWGYTNEYVCAGVPS